MLNQQSHSNSKSTESTYPNHMNARDNGKTGGFKWDGARDTFLDHEERTGFHKA